MTYFNSRGTAMPESTPEQGRIAGTSVGNETINAVAGPSSLSGEGGGDLLIGNNFDNRHWITNPYDRVVEQASGGIDTEIGWTSIKLADNVENLTVNGGFNYAVGNSLDNLITVDNETHWIYGAGGDDVLVGGATGKDTYIVRAGEGSDVIYNWNGNSQVQLLNYSLASPAQVLSAMTQTGADVVLTLSATESLTFRATTLDAFSDRQFLLPLDQTKLGAETFSDEFNTLQLQDPSLQTGVWATNFGGNYKDPWAFTLPSNGERQVYVTPTFSGQGEADLDINPFSVGNGVLTITARPIPDAQRDAAWGREYSSGMLNTLGTFEQQYGYFEMRAQMPEAVGAWPAFWMMPSPYVAQVEADIMEGLAITPNVDYRRAWGGGDNLYDNAYKIDPAGFHTYGMLWTPTTVTFYYDGTAVLQAPTPGNWTEPMGMIVNMAVGGWGGEPNSLMFPTELKIDYVKAWALADGSTVVDRHDPEPPAATLRADGGLTSSQTNVTATFQDDGQAVTTSKIAVFTAKPAAPTQETFVIWQDAGAVFGAVAKDGAYAQSTVLMAGSSSTFTSSGTWLTDGKVVVGYMMPDGAGKAAWAMVFDPAKLTFERHELGPATGDIRIVATANGGFAASWDTAQGTVMGRAYDSFAYDGEGWYGPARQLAGDLTGVTANGELITTNGQGAQQLYDVVNPPKPINAVISAGPMAGVSHAEGNSGATLYTFTLIRDWDQSEKSTVGWTVRGQGANPTDAADFQGGVLPSGVATFEINQTTAFVQVWVNGDTMGEQNEEFILTLVNPVGAKLGQATATGFVTNDDAGGAPPPPTQPQIAFTSGAVTHAEGASGLTAFAFTVTRDGPTTGTSSVNWSLAGSGANPASAADFQNGVMPGGSLTFAAGETSKTLTVNVAGDTTVETDEAFTLTLSGASGATLGQATVAGVITNDDTASPSGGQVIASNSYGATLTGGAGGDTLIAGQGPDVLTGGGGGDVFSYGDLVWNAGKITDFALGTDRLDFSPLFQKYGYTGSDPVGDRYVTLSSDGAGGTVISFDSDGPASGNPWPYTMTTLTGVSSTGLTWGQLTTAGTAPPPPPPSGGSGVVINSPGPGSTLTGGAGADTLNASQGADVLTGGGGADSFAFAAAPWSAGHITDFVVGVDRLDLSAIFQSSGFTGSDPVAAGRMRFDAEGSGTAVYFDRDAPNTGDWPFKITVLDGVSPTGLTWATLSTGGGTTSPPPASGAQIALTTPSLSLAEGNSGVTAFSYTVARTGSTTGASSANWSVAGSGANPASASDFQGAALPSGVVNFAAGETSKTLVVNVLGDTTVEPTEGFTVTLSGASGATLGTATATGAITDDDTTPGGGSGMVINSTGPRATLTGGPGADTLNASQGGDQLTGGAGADTFAWAKEPWEPARVTDFSVGTDKLDLSALFKAANYTGVDPIADKYIWLLDNGAGGTKVLFDKDGAATAQQWPNYVINLEQTPTAGLTWAQLSGGGATPAPTPPPSSGESTFVVFAGQSNMGGAYMTASTVSAAWVPDPKTLIWDPTSKVWAQMKPGVNTGYGDQPNAWGPEVQFAIDFRAKFPDEILRIVKKADGGTGLDLNSGAYVADWSPESNGELFDQAKTMIGEAGAAAGGIRPDMVFFGQGEEDATTSTAANAYATNLPAFLSAVRAEWMSDSQGKVGIFMIGDTPPYAAAVRSAQLQTDQGQVNTGSFDTADYPLQSDNLHYTAAGYNMAGSGFFSLFGSLTSGGGSPPATSPPPSGGGMVINSSAYGDSLTGGAQNDTLNAGQGPDVLTGGGGADRFVFAAAPWNPGRITDFTPGVDKIDLRGILDSAGYTGANAIADRYVLLEATANGTKISVDMDGPQASGQWPVTVTVLTGVSPSALTSSDWIFQ